MGTVENYELEPLQGQAPVRVNRRPDAQSPRSFEAARPVLEALPDPVLIVSGSQKIIYLNAAARKLLANGLDKRLETHLRTRPDKAALSQVRFKLANGHDLVLKIHLTSVGWMGQSATQVSVADVTPYLAAVTQTQFALATQRRTLDRLRAQQAAGAKAAVMRTEPSAQTEAPGAETVQNLQTQLNEQSGRLAEAEKETERLNQELRRTSEDNAQLRKDFATLVRVREELKESRQRVQEQFQELQARRTSGAERQDDERRASEERIRVLDDALAKANADLEAESRKAREAHAAREAEQSQLLAKISELMSLRDELETKVAAFAAETNAAREQIGVAVTGRETQGQECARLSAKLAEQAEELDAQAAELVRLRELTHGQVDELMKFRESVARQMQTSAEDRKKLAEETERLRAELAGAAGRKDELAREAETLRRDGAEAGRQLEEASSRRQALEKERTTLQQNIAELEQARAEAEKARDALEREAHRDLQAEKGRGNRLAEEVKTLCAELGGARGKQEESDREADTLRLAVAESRRQLEEESSQRQALERERATLRQDIESLERSRAKAEKAREAVEQEARTQADGLARAREEIDALSSKRETAEQERASAVQRAYAEAGLRVRVEEQNVQLRAQLQTAQDAANEQHDRATETQQQAELLSHELKDARSELTRQAEAAQERQDEWAGERADLESRAQLAATALDNATEELQKSDAARQRAEKQAVEAHEKLAEQIKAAKSAHAVAQRFETQAKEQAEALAQAGAALNSEAAGRAEAQKEAEKLNQNLAEVRGELARRVEAARTSQAVWAEERASLAARAQQLIQSLNDVTDKLQQSDIARQCAEGQVAAVHEKLAEQAKAAKAVETNLVRLEKESKDRADALAQANVVLSAERAKLARTEEESAGLKRELAQTRSDLARRTEVAQKKQDAWAQERTDLESRALQLTQSLNDAIDKLQQSDIARQRAEEQVATVHEKLAEQTKAAKAVEANLVRSEKESKDRADALAQANAALNAETAERARAEETRDALKTELEIARQSKEAVCATLAQYGERVASLEREETETRLKTESRLQEEARVLDDARSESIGLRRQIQELTAVLEGADQATRQQSAARERAEEELERLRAELCVAAERSARAESDGASLAGQLGERTMELNEVKQQLGAKTAEVLLAQASCQVRAQEVLDLRCLASTLEKKYATLEKHIKARTREQTRLIRALDQQIGRRRNAEAEKERFQREVSPERETSHAAADAVEPATHGAAGMNALARLRREFLPGNQPATDTAAKVVPAL